MSKTARQMIWTATDYSASGGGHKLDALARGFVERGKVGQGRSESVQYSLPVAPDQVCQL